VSRPPAWDEYVDRFRQDVLADAFAEALPAHWRRRADTFAAVGTAACDEVATACRHHADFLELYPLDVLELSAAELARAA